MVISTWAAVTDLKKREVSSFIILTGLIPGVITAFMTGITAHLLAMSTGAALLLLSKVTRQAIGYGDGLFFIMTACYFSPSEVFLLFLGAAGVAFIWGSILLFRDIISVKRSVWNEGIPFLSCVWPVGLLIVFGG